MYTYVHYFTITAKGFCMNDSSRDSVEDAVNLLLERMHIEGPPVDAVAIAKRLGIEVRLDRDQSSRGRLVHGRRQPVICVRPEPRIERSQWTVAHEIGEHLIAKELLVPQSDRDEFDYPGRSEMLREETANRFANVLLAPGRWFAADCAATAFNLPFLKERYRTASFEVLAMRMLDLSQPSIITIFDNNELIRRRSNLTGGLPTIDPVELSAQAKSHATGEAVHVPGEQRTVTCWPVHEPGWKREILRTRLEGVDVW
jgi:Zn-dependent peptidase ImmA (M78 family)